MSLQFPGLLQPWGVAAFILITLIAFLLAFRWQRAREGRSKIEYDVAALAMLALLTGGFFWRPLTESGITMPSGGGDLASFYFPTYVYVAEQIQGGTLPLWNPHLYSGTPLAADVQTALFYPLNWILYLSPDLDYGSLLWLLIGHYFLAAAFSYLFLRDIGLRRLGSLAGAITFGFCGFMVAHLGHMPMVPVASWIPLILLAVRRAFINQTLTGWAWAITAGLIMTMSLFAGHVQIFAYGLIAAGLLALYLLLSGGAVRRERLVPWAAKGALMLTLALGIGAVQLIPSLELSNQSIRSSVSYEEASAFPAQPITLLNLFLPRVYGSSPTTYNFGDYQSTENWGYIGVVALALAAAGLVLRRDRMLGYFALLTALSLILIVGDLTILHGWIYNFAPGFNKLRDAGRALVLLGLGLSGLAAFGLDALVSALTLNHRYRGNAFRWLLGLSAVIGVVALLILPLSFLNLLSNSGAQYGRLPGAINDLGMLLLWLSLLSGIGWAAYRGRIESRAAGALILAILVLDLFSPNSRFNPTGEDVLAGYKHFSAVGALHKETQDPRTNVPFRINSDADAQDIWQPSSALLHSGRDAPMYDTGGAFNPLKLARYDTLWKVAKDNIDTPLYDLTGVAFEVITDTRRYLNQPKWQQFESYPGFQVYRNTRVMPRAFLVHEAFIEPRQDEIINRLRNFSVEPWHAVILETGNPVTSDKIGTAEALLTNRPTDESVFATRYSPNAVDLKVRATSPGWVVLTDSYHPGWEATVDGQPATIEPANLAYRAVRVDEGEHTISMQFRPASWVWGRLISLASLAAGLLALAPILFRLRHAPRP